MMMMRSLVLAGLLASLCLALAIAATAMDKVAARKACRSDYERLCPSVLPGQGRIIACLQSHLDALAPACRAIVEEQIAAKK